MVVVLGALLGWYFFLRGQTQATSAADLARGFSASAPFGAQTGSTYQNMLSNVIGGPSAPGGASPRSLPQLWHADVSPVAGFAFTGSASSSVLSFAERGNGYVLAGDPVTQTVVRLTNTLMPKINEVFFGGTGGVIERTIDASHNITTFVGRIATSTSDAIATTTARALSGTYLDTNIIAIALNPATEELFYLENGAPRIMGVRAQSDGSKKKTVFSSAIADWRLTSLSDGRIILLTSPADGIPGYAYTLRSDGSLAPLVRATPGLTILPRTSSPAILYGQSTGSGLILFAQVKADTSVVTLPVRTIADKCVWAPGADLIAYCAVPRVPPTGNFLNDWYKGATHTTDAWWRIDVSAGQAQLIYTPDQSLSLDVESPVISANGAYLAFRDARDGSLWVLRLQK